MFVETLIPSNRHILFLIYFIFYFIQLVVVARELRTEESGHLQVISLVFTDAIMFYDTILTAFLKESS